MTSKTNLLRADFVALIIILAAGLKFTYGLYGAVDIALRDESNYLIGFHSAQFGPIYCAWYALLARFAPDRVCLYYLNVTLMTFLPSILLYIVLRRNRVSLTASFVLSILFLVSIGNFSAQPKVSHFAVLVMLGTFACIGPATPFFTATGIACIGALLAAYVPPEYFLAFLAFAALLAGLCAVRYRQLQPRDIKLAVAVAVLSVVVIAALGSPLAGGRGFMAFGQHFSLNWVNWNHSTIDPWANWEQIVAQNFGNAHSITAAALNNPELFLRHLGRNLWRLSYFPASFFPVGYYAAKWSRLALLIAAIGAFVLCWANARANVTRCRGVLLLIGFYLLTSLGCMTLIYPRDHYLILLDAPLLVIAAILLADPAADRQVNFKRLALCGAFLIALLPFAKNTVGVNVPNLETIRFIRSLHITQPVNLLEVEGGYDIYLGKNFHRMPEYEKRTGFDQFRAEKAINAIVVSNYLSEDVRFKDDPEWQRFLADPGQSGFTRLAIPRTKHLLILKNGLVR
jgi:hypothetical protein